MITMIIPLFPVLKTTVADMHIDKKDKKKQKTTKTMTSRKKKAKKLAKAKKPTRKQLS